MTSFLFPPAAPPSIAIVGDDRRFPVSRLFCVGRNYADHAKEMGAEVDREAPFFFLKQAQAIVADGAALPYAPGTANFHHEVEFVVAIGAEARAVAVENAMEAVFGYAVGLDMTRRDLQFAARDKGRPWDFGKNFEASAPISAIVPKAAFGEIGDRAIALSIDGTVRQRSHLGEMVWSVPELIAHLSRYYTLRPGDLLFTGTPAGVGPVVAGNRLTATIDGLPTLEVTVVAAT